MKKTEIVKTRGGVLLLGEGGRRQMQRILKRMKEESEALEKLMKIEKNEEQNDTRRIEQDTIPLRFSYKHGA